MTTWAYRDGILASDTLVTISTHRDGYVRKIAKRGHYLAAVAGVWPIAIRFLDWFANGLPADRTPNMGDGKENLATGYVFCPDDLILTFSDLGWSRRRAAYYACGSGCDYAYGAMAMGATAEQAVRAALIFETASGGDVTVLRRSG